MSESSSNADEQNPLEREGEQVLDPNLLEEFAGEELARLHAYLERNRERIKRRADQALDLPWYLEAVDGPIINAAIGAVLRAIATVVDEDRQTDGSS